MSGDDDKPRTNRRPASDSTALDWDRGLAEIRTTVAIKTAELSNDLKMKSSEISAELKLAESRLETKLAALDSRIGVLKSEASELVSSRMRFLAVAGTLVALAVFFGAPEYFKLSLRSKITGYDKDVKDLLKRIDGGQSAMNELLERASRQQTILVASDYRETDGYARAVLGRIAATAPELPRPLYMQLPLNSPEAAAAKIGFLAKYFPKGTVIAGIYNPDGFGSKLFVCWTKNGHVFVGHFNSFSQRLIASLGGAAKAAWLERLPGAVAFGDSGLLGLSRIAPAAALLASARTKEIKPDDFGTSIDPSAINPSERPNPLAGWVIDADGYGNCLTSISMTELKNRLGENFERLRVTLGSESMSLPYYRNFADARRGELFAIEFDGMLNFAAKLGSFTDKHPNCKDGVTVLAQGER